MMKTWVVKINFTGYDIELHFTGDYNYVCEKAMEIAKRLGGYFNYDINEVV